MLEKPFSQACENNQQAIFAVLERVFAKAQQVLEIGSGTGQHAAYFAPRLPHLIWQTSICPSGPLPPLMLFLAPTPATL